jgi:hypothetical protein
LSVDFLRIQIILFENYFQKMKTLKFSVNSILFKSIHFKFLNDLRRYQRKLFFQKLSLKHLIQLFKEGELYQCRSIMEKEEFPVYVKQMVISPIRWKIYSFRRSFGFNVENEVLFVKEEKSIFMSNIAPSRLYLYLRNPNEYPHLLLNEEDLIKELTKVLFQFVHFRKLKISHNQSLRMENNPSLILMKQTRFFPNYFQMNQIQTLSCH